MKTDLNIALVGCGKWGENIARNLHQMGVLNWIYDLNQKLSEKVRQEYKLPAVELNDIFKDQNINAIVIASPAITHSNLAFEALNYNKDLPIMRAHGVPEISAYLKNKITLDDCIKKIQLDCFITKRDRSKKNINDDDDR